MHGASIPEVTQGSGVTAKRTRISVRVRITPVPAPAPDPRGRTGVFFLILFDGKNGSRQFLSAPTLCLQNQLEPEVVEQLRGNNMTPSET